MVNVAPALRTPLTLPSWSGRLSPRGQLLTLAPLAILSKADRYVSYCISGKMWQQVIYFYWVTK